MTREVIIQKTINTLNLLPDKRAAEVLDFADQLLEKHKEELFQEGIEKLMEQSQAFQFLNQDENLYTDEDLKERY